MANFAFLECTHERLFFRSDFSPDKHQFRAIEFKRLQIPAASDEIEKLHAVSEAGRNLSRESGSTGRLSANRFETIARKNFGGSECE